jgi:hypothetical protein
MRYRLIMAVCYLLKTVYNKLLDELDKGKALNFL